MIKVLILCGLLFISGASLANCNTVERNGDSRSSEITGAFNDHFKGFKKNFYVGKFKVVRAVSVGFEGCTGTIKMKVKLDRSWPFKDASGTVRLKGLVSRLDSNKICLRNASIVDISLTNTSGAEEDLYKKIANPFMGPLSRCYELS